MITNILHAALAAIKDFFHIGFINSVPGDLQFKDDPTPSEELKAAIENFGKTFDEFKQANDERLAEIEKKASADVLLEEKVDKINVALGGLEDIKTDLEDLETKVNAAQLGGGGGDVNPDQVEHAKAFDKFFRKGNDDGLAEFEAKAMNTQVDPDGGYAVPVEMEAGIDRVLSEVSPIRTIATVRNIGAATYKKLVNTGGAGSGWVGEEESRPETGTPALKELAFQAMELYANPATTQAMLDDAAFDIEGFLSDEITIEFAEQEGAAFVTGDGVLRPRGFLSYTNVANASYSWGNIGYIASGGAGAFAASNPSDKLIDLVHALKQGYRQNARWVMDDLTVAVIRKFKDGDGHYIWQPGLQAGIASTLLGYPSTSANDMPDIAANTYSIAFGDFQRAYVIVDRVGIRVLRDPYTNKPYVMFYTTKRVGGGVQNFEALKLMKFATS